MRLHPFSLAALCAFALPALAHAQTLLPAQADDLVPHALLAQSARSTVAPGPARPRVHRESQPIQVSWPLAADAAVVSTPEPFSRPSRGYAFDTSATELKQGVDLPLSAPGAVIRLSASDTQAGRLDPARIQLHLGGRSLRADAASLHIADAPALQAAGMAVPAGSLALQLKPELGSGAATLQVEGASGRYLVQVLEPQSRTSLSARADHASLLAGETATVELDLRDDAGRRPITAAGGFLLAPDGSSVPLRYRPLGDGRYAAEVSPQAASSQPGGLWEVQSFTLGTDADGHAVRRDGTTVLAVAAPSARFTGRAQPQRLADGGVQVTLGIEAAAGSRYAVSGVLYGRDRDGRLRAGAYAQAAAVLPAGTQPLALRFDPSSVRDIAPPYELHDLRLQDQSAVSTLERRGLAMRFGL
ncbi:DUF4785 domain-containing protein [Frateuria defendens]|uniref:DUF4785 domain-containing protein n=1 Tax=Frateuria defendens TaxID=2219559 RepID=UPI00066FD318|nr:DUF4785 domain-containing protein [Frateuria defendens]